MIGDGIEPHDWEPSARDLTRLAKAKVFVYNGGVEPWAQPALDAVADEGVLPVKAGKAFMAEQNSRLDPHFWLSPRKAETEVLAGPLKPAKRLWRNKTAGSTRTSG